jgi:hypothetical protein
MAGYYKGKIDPSTDDVADFFIKYFSPHESLFKSKDFSVQFFKVFRHGLAHQWSPKASAVAMNFNSKDSFYFILGNSTELPCLNIPAFYKLTKKALRDYENDLNNEKYIKEFRKRYERVIEIDYREMNKLKSMFQSS